MTKICGVGVGLGLLFVFVGDLSYRFEVCIRA